LEQSGEKPKKQLRKEIANLLSNTSVKANGLDFVTVEGKNINFKLIGCGCTSAVFRSEHLITQVDDAIAAAKTRGLVPSDVHFKNNILNGNQVTLIDLSDYMSAKHTSRWERLKFFYQ